MVFIWSIELLSDTLIITKQAVPGSEETLGSDVPFLILYSVLQSIKQVIFSHSANDLCYPVNDASGFNSSGLVWRRILVAFASVMATYNWS